jgi:hypothetical protein
LVTDHFAFKKVTFFMIVFWKMYCGHVYFAAKTTAAPNQGCKFWFDK